METAVLLISLWVASVVGIKQVDKPTDNICVDVTVEQTNE